MIQSLILAGAKVRVLVISLALSITRPELIRAQTERAAYIA